MKHSHKKLFALLTITTFIQISFAMGRSLPNKNSAQLQEKGNKVQIIQDGEVDKLQFFDEQGRKKEDVELGEKEIEKPNENLQYFNRSAKISKSSKVVAIIENYGREYSKNPPPDSGDGVFTNSKSRITIKSVDGNTIWEKETPAYRTVAKFEISENGDHLVTIESRSDENEPKSPREQLVVYNNKGETVFIFPKKKTYQLNTVALKIAPSGQYVSALGFKGNTQVVLFFDIFKNLFWEEEAKYRISQILDNGTAVYFGLYKNQREFKFKPHLKTIDEY